MTVVKSELLIVSSSVRGAALPGGGAADANHVRKYSDSWASGSGTSQTDLAWSASRSLPVGTSTDDLQSLTQLDADGNTLSAGLNFANIKSVLIKNTLAPGATGTLRVGNAAANPWDGTGCLFRTATGDSDIEPGGSLLWTNPTGGAVAAGAKDFMYEAIGGTVTYEVQLKGDSV